MAGRGEWYRDEGPSKYRPYAPSASYEDRSFQQTHNMSSMPNMSSTSATGASHRMPFNSTNWSTEPQPPPSQIHHSRQCLGCSDLRNNMEFVETQSRRLAEENQRMKTDMEAMQRKMSQPDPDALREMQRLRDEVNDRMKQYLQEKEAKESIEHKFNQCKLELNNNKTSFDLERKAWSLAEANMKKQRDLEREQATEKLELDRAQRQREIDHLSKDKEQAAKDADKSRNQLEETISKLRKQSDVDRAALNEAQASISRLNATVDAIKEDGRRKDELNGLLQKENETKQERIDEALKLVSSLQSKNNELEMNTHSFTVELARLNETVEVLKKSKSNLEVQNQAENKDVEKWRSAYTEICSILGANGVEIRGVQANSVASAIVAEVSRLKHDLVKKDLEIAEEKNEAELQKMKVQEIERGKNDIDEALLAKEDQCAQLEEELYTTMHELRQCLDKCDAHDVEAATSTNRLKAATDAIEKKDKEITRLYQDLKEKESALTKTSATWLDERAKLEDVAKQELTVLNFDHNQESRRLESQIQQAHALAKEQVEYADMCESLAKVLEVGKGYSLTSALKARQIFEAVQGLLQNKDELLTKVEILEGDKQDIEEDKRELFQQVKALEMQIEEAVEHHRELEADLQTKADLQTTAMNNTHTGNRTIDNPWDTRTATGTRRLLVSHKLNDSGLGNEKTRTGAEQRLREETRVLRSKMAKINLQHHEFVRNIAHALGIHQDPGDVVNLEVFTQQVRDLMEERPTRSNDYHHTNTKNNKTSHANPKKIELVQQKYRTALRTIQTYDKILADVKANSEQSSTHTGVNNSLLFENHELVEEIHTLKEQLYGNQDGAFDLGTDNLDDVREELKKYAQFYDQLCKVLQFRHNPTFIEVVDKVTRLTGGAGKSLAASHTKFATTSTPMVGGSSKFSLSRGGSKIYAPHRPTGSASNSMHVHRREVPEPWK